MLKRIFLFYYDGFRPIIRGRTSRGIILIKLFVMFLIHKFFHFPNMPNRIFGTDEGRAGYVLEQLTNAIYND